MPKYDHPSQQPKEKRQYISLSGTVGEIQAELAGLDPGLYIQEENDYYDTKAYYVVLNSSEIEDWYRKYYEAIREKTTNRHSDKN